MIKQHLHENWKVRAAGDISEVPASLRAVTLPARVSGCVHTELLRAGKIDDPYLDRNEFAVRWIGHTDWEYRTTFDADANLFDHERIDLACDGLDTVATIVLNGSGVARTQNMHRGYRFDVRSLLKCGTNELVVTFASPVKYAEAMQRKLGRRPYVNGPAGPFNFIRKMACNFGWDWGPALPTSGIWRPIRLEGYKDVELIHVIPHVRFPDAAHAVVDCDIFLEGLRQHPGRIALSAALHDPNGERYEASDETDGHLPDRFGPKIVVRNPLRWWPRGHGEQPLYRLEITFKNESSEIVNS